MTSYSLDDRWQENRQVWRDYWRRVTLERFGTSLAIVAVLIAILGYINQHGWLPSLTNITTDFYANVSSELIGIVITVFFLDRLNARRQDKQELTRLKALLGSKETVVAKIAVAELKARGWVDDGTLTGAALRSSNLSNISIVGAQLERVDFRSSDFDGASLVGANLQQANLLSTNFTRANLFEANLQKANLMSANLNGSRCTMARLQGAELFKANLRDVDLSLSNLEGANLEGAILEGITWGHTILPDGTLMADDVDLKRFTNPEHVEFHSTRAAINELRKQHGLKPLT